MASNDRRLRRLLEEELGDCCAGDVDERMRELQSIDDAVPSDVDADLAALGTLGDGTRYRIVRLLAAADGELCVCELEPLLSVSDSAISHALSDLADADLVTRRKAGTWRYYQVTERAAALVETLDATRDADAPAAEVEA